MVSLSSCVSAYSWGLYLTLQSTHRAVFIDVQYQYCQPTQYSLYRPSYYPVSLTEL